MIKHGTFFKYLTYIDANYVMIGPQDFAPLHYIACTNVCLKGLDGGR